jgi:hypothetical protein
MTLVLKALVQPNTEGDRLFITDVTGAYAASTNEGGWGDAGVPNPDLVNSALVAIAIRKASEGDENLAPVATAARFNPLATNDDQTTFEFYYKNDGSHNAYLMRLPVSSDAIVDLDGNTLVDGDYFYNSVLLDVYKMVGATPTLLESLSEMIDNDTIVQTLCQDIFQPLQAKDRAARYLKMVATRKTNCSENPEFQDLRGHTEDLISNDYAFRSGLTIQAQDMVEQKLDELNIDNVN